MHLPSAGEISNKTFTYGNCPSDSRQTVFSTSLFTATVTTGADLFTRAYNPDQLEDVWGKKEDR